MDIKKQYEIKLEELQITKIPADQITKDSRSYLYNEMVVETISFNTSKIINQIRFFNYLKYMKEVKNQYTIKNIIGYTIISEMFYLIVEKVNDQKTLSDVINDLNFIDKLRVVIQLIALINYFHNFLKITPKLLASNNLFFQGNLLKINVCHPKRIIQECSNENNLNKDQQLYLEYLPPDLWDSNNNEDDGGEIEFKNEGNIWSLGCILSEIFSGIVPWSNRNNKNKQILKKLLCEKRPFPIPESIKNIENSIYNIIKDCTEINPASRPSIHHIQKLFSRMLQNKENIYILLQSFSKGKLRKLNKKSIISVLCKFM